MTTIYKTIPVEGGSFDGRMMDVSGLAVGDRAAWSQRYFLVGDKVELYEPEPVNDPVAMVFHGHLELVNGKYRRKDAK